MGDSAYQCDVFISYSHADKEWVHGWLLPRLEAAGLRVCIDFRDFDIGVPSLVNMERAVDNSRHTLLVLSPAWVESEWTEFEALLTQTADPAGRRRRLLSLLFQPCQLPRRIAMLTYADFTQPSEWDTQLHRVVAAIRGELRLPDVGSALHRLLVPESPPFFVPFPRNPDFVGREKDLAALHELVHQSDSPVGIRPTVLVGLGGIGKTQLAVEYAHVYRDEYPSGIFWLNAIKPLLHEFADLAEILGLADKETPRDQAAHKAWAFLDARQDALVVLDNVIEPAKLNIPFAPGLIPANLRCRTLFTTRQRDFPRGFQPYEVKVLPEMAAMHLLLRARPEVLDEHHPDWGVARVVCAMLGWLPLALELAAAYLDAYPDVALGGYVERLRTEGKLATVDDTDLRPEELPTRHEVAVTATLRTQWSRLDNEDARLLFRTAGQLPAGTWIPISRLGLLTGITAGVAPGRPAPLTRALKKLHDVSLIEELTNERLRLHPLVQEFAAGLSSSSFRAKMAAQIAAALNEASTLEAHVIQRGVNEVLEDLRTGLWLCAGSPTDESAHARLARLERALGREAPNLQGWNWEQHPTFFAQQVHNRAVIMELPDLASNTSARLAQLAKHHIALLWRVGPESPALERTLAGHAASVRAVAVAPTGDQVVSASEDGTLKIWGLQAGREERTLSGHADTVLAVAITPDAHRAVSASADHTLKVWDLRAGWEERALRGHAGPVRAVAITPDGCRAVSASHDRTIRVWNIRTGRVERILGGHTGNVTSVAVMPDGHRVVSASDDSTLRVWDLQKGKEERVLGHGAWVFDVAVTPDGRCAISAGQDGALKVWDLQRGQEVYTLSGHSAPVLAAAVTPDGRWAISASQDRKLKVWNLETGREERTFSGHSSAVRAVAVTPDGRRAVSASYDRTLKVWGLQPKTRGVHPQCSYGPRVGRVGNSEQISGYIGLRGSHIESVGLTDRTDGTYSSRS